MKTPTAPTDEAFEAHRAKLDAKARAAAQEAAETSRKQQSEREAKVRSAPAMEAAFLRIHGLLGAEALNLRKYGYCMELRFLSGDVPRSMAAPPPLPTNFVDGIEAFVGKDEDVTQTPDRIVKAPYKILAFWRADEEIAIGLIHKGGQDHLAAFNASSMNDAAIKKVYGAAIADILELDETTEQNDEKR